MEYLVTYGWALLALFVVVAYLIASGAFSANSFASQECVFQPDLPCTSYIIYKSGGSTMVGFSLANGLGFPVEILYANYSLPGVGEESGGPKVDRKYASGEKIEFSQKFTGGGQPQPRDFRTVQVVIEYVNCRNSPCSGPYTTSGRVSAIVEGG
jgi:hypothetical protein